MHIYDIRTLCNYFPTLLRQHQRPRDDYKPYSKCIFTTYALYVTIFPHLRDNITGPSLWYAMLCYAVLCYAMLCYGSWHCFWRATVPFHEILQAPTHVPLAAWQHLLCCVALRCAAPRRAVLCCAVLCRACFGLALGLLWVCFGLPLIAFDPI